MGSLTTFENLFTSTQPEEGCENLRQALLRAAKASSQPTLALPWAGQITALDLSADPLFGSPADFDCRYFERVAPSFEKLQVLKLSGNRLLHLEGLESLLPKLKGLHLAKLGSGDLGTLRDVEFLKSATSLEELDISRNAITSLKPLAALTQLRVLSASGNLIDDLAALAKLRNLRKLHLNDNRLRSLEDLQDLYYLNELSFKNNGIRSLKPLKDLRDLTRVSLAGNPLHEDDFDIIPRSVRIE
jgi:Leucine-rich repeat (LRR) protein